MLMNYHVYSTIMITSGIYTIRDMRVINGKKISGGAINFFQPRGTVIENVRFENNISPEGYGRSVIASSYLSAFILDSTSVLIKDVEVVNNQGGRAIALGPFEYTRIENTIIKGTFQIIQQMIGRLED